MIREQVASEQSEQATWNDSRLYTELFYTIIPTLFSYFLLFCYPYISLDF